MYIFQIKKWWDKIKRELDLCGYTNLLLSWEPYESLALEEEVHSIAGKCNALLNPRVDHLQPASLTFLDMALDSAFDIMALGKKNASLILGAPGTSMCP